MTLATSGTGTPLEASTAAAIKRLLRARLGRQWRVGDRLPPVKELARQLGTGQSNTHQAVRELAAEGVLESRQRRGTYVLRDASAGESQPTLRRGGLTGRTIHLYCAPSPEGFIQRMIDAFTDAISPTGARMVTGFLPVVNDPPLQTDPQADALVLFNPSSTLPIPCEPHQLLTVVSTVARVHIEQSQRYDVVTVDELHGGALAGQMLRAAGCRDVCYAGRGIPPAMDRFDATSALRLYGFESAWGATLAPANILFAQGYSPQAGGKAFRHYMAMPRRPEGVFCASDDLAIGFIAGAEAHGITAGKDFQIVGFDGQDRGQAMGEGSLTTVKVPAVEMGRRAAQLLMQRFAEPDRPIHRLQLECALHRGTTTHIPVMEQPS